MRFVLLAVALVAMAGLAGNATAHWVVGMPTPAGTVCAVHEERLIDGARTLNPSLVLSGVVSVGGC